MAPTNFKAEERNADILLFEPGNRMRDMDHEKSPAGTGKFWESATFYVCLGMLFLESLDFRC